MKAGSSAASAILRLQAQLCREKEVCAWQVSTALLPAPRPSYAITSGSEPWTPQEEGNRGNAHLT